MYKQVYNTRSNVLPLILLAVTGGLCLLCIPSVINMTSFVWIYELAVILLVVAAVYLIMKKSCYTYIYHIIDDEVVVTMALGSREIILCSFEIRDILEIIEEPKVKAVREKYKCRLFYKCIGNGDVSKSTVIVFREEKKPQNISFISFMPDKEFLQFLNGKRLDN